MQAGKVLGLKETATNTSPKRLFNHLAKDPCLVGEQEFANIGRA